MSEKDVYRQIAAKVQMPNSRWIPMILEKIITPEEARMVLELPMSVDEFAEKYGISKQAAEQKLEDLANKGVCLPLTKQGVEKFFCVGSIIQVHDATIHGALNERYSPVPMEIIEMWRNFRETEWFEVLKMMEQLPYAHRGRCIPSWSTVMDHPELTDSENLRTILTNAPAIAVVDCPCRWLQVQEGTCDKPTFTCLSLTNGSVKYIEDRKIGKVLTLEEGFTLLKECEEAGLIPTAGGSGGQPKQICMCSVPECIILRGQVKYGYDLWNRSRFDAVVDPQTCQGCETCVGRCQFGAISMMDGVARVDTDKCFGCGVCAVTCPTGALSLNLVRPIEHLTGTGING
ncbi:MAG: 4Fe-4S binding protein [Desulfobacterales bacterium]